MWDLRGRRGLRDQWGDSGVPPVDPNDPAAQDSALATLAPGAVTLTVSGISGAMAVGALSRVGFDVPSGATGGVHTVIAPVIIPITVANLGATSAQLDALEQWNAAFRTTGTSNGDRRTVTISAFTETGEQSSSHTFGDCVAAAFSVNPVSHANALRVACSTLDHMTHVAAFVPATGPFSVRFSGGLSLTAGATAALGGDVETELRFSANTGYTAGPTTVSPLRLAELPARALELWVLDFFDPRGPAAPDVAVSSIDPADGTATQLAVYTDCVGIRGDTVQSPGDGSSERPLRLDGRPHAAAGDQAVAAVFFMVRGPRAANREPPTANLYSPSSSPIGCRSSM